MPAPSQQKPFVVPVFIPHAGCPHRCVFCNQRKTTGQKAPLPAVCQIHETISRFLSFRQDAHRRTEISFYGGNFLGLPPDQISTLLGLGATYVAAGTAQGLRFSTRPDSINPDTLALISGFPVTTIELGVQSLNDKVLAACRRGHTVLDTHRAVSLLRSEPYRLGLQMMVGLPEDTPARSLDTAREIAALCPDFVRIYPTLVLEGSPLAQWFAQGRYAPMGLNETVELVRRLLSLFLRNNIKVVRMGLQPTEDLNADRGVVAGPFHPAFGELVYSALWRAALQAWFSAHRPDGRSLEITVHPSMLSRLRGYKNENLNWMHAQFNGFQIVISASPDLPTDRALINGTVCRLF